MLARWRHEMTTVPTQQKFSLHHWLDEHCMAEKSCWGTFLSANVVLWFGHPWKYLADVCSRLSWLWYYLFHRAFLTDKIQLQQFFRDGAIRQYIFSGEPHRRSQKLRNRSKAWVYNHSKWNVSRSKDLSLRYPGLSNSWSKNSLLSKYIDFYCASSFFILLVR